jgi:cysteine synthase B
MPLDNIIDTIGNTPIVELKKLKPSENVQLFAKLEGTNPTGSVKDRIAKYMIEKAESEDMLGKNKIILEPTSGNTGIALAMIGRYKGYKVEVVMPENVSPERINLLRAYGAKIHFSKGSEGTNGAVRYAEAMVAENPDLYFMPYQYGNDANPKAHSETTAIEIIQDVPDISVFVAGLGTGGTLTGVGRRLKEHNPDIQIIAAAPEPDDTIQGLRSLEDGFIPPILDLNVLDARLMIPSEEAFHYTKILLQEEAIFAGVSSGAAIACAIQFAKRLDKGKIVCLLADGGWKYLSTGLWSQEYSDLKGEVAGKIWW